MRERKLPRPLQATILLAVIILANFIAFNGCSKTSKADLAPAPPSEIRQQFFNVSAVTDPVVQAIAKAIGRQDGERDFVPALSKKAGFPRWDKAIIASSKYGDNQALKGGTDTGEIIILPFVKDQQLVTNAILLVNTGYLNATKRDTLYKLIYSSRYEDYGFNYTDPSKAGAKNIFHLFAYFDNAIFGYKDFMVKDARIVTGNPKDTTAETKVTMVDGKGSSVTNRLASITFCNSFEICNLCAFKTTGRVLDGCRCGSTISTYCTTVWFETGGGDIGGGGFPPGGGGGGGGGGGWENTDPCRTAPNVNGPCGSGPTNPPPVGPGGGWVPVTPVDDDPIDSLLARAARVANKHRDSMAALCESQHKERFFCIVLNNNQMDTFRVVIGQTDDAVKPNYYMSGGRILRGSWHYHPKYSDGTLGSWPSGGDVANLFDKQNGFVSIVDTETGRYALVVENATQMDTWKRIRGNGPAVIGQRVVDSIYSDPRVWNPADYVNLTRDKLIAILGSAASCGIGLYYSPTTNGTQFIKVN